MVFGQMLYSCSPPMAAEETTLTVARRTEEGSRASRRLRRQGLVPGIVYGGDADPVPIQADARELRAALAHGGAVIELSLDGERMPVVLKEQQRHPVSGATLHVDMLRVDLSRRIQVTVVVELVGAENAPGVKAGGVLEQVTREITIEALPTAIPDVIEHDVSTVEIGETVYLSALTPPPGVEVVDDPETVLASVLAPRLSTATAEEAAEGEAEGEGEAGGSAGGE